MKNFNTIYQEIYREHYAVLVKLKKKTVFLQIALAICALIFSLILYFVYTYSIFRFIILPFAMVLLYLISTIRSSRFIQYYKKYVIQSLIQDYDDSFVYHPSSSVPSSTYRDAEFEQSFDRYASEDTITGQCQDFCPLLMGEVKTERKYTDKDGHTSYSTIFSGFFVAIEFPKLLPCTIRIRKNATLKSMLSSPSRHRKNKNSSPIERIEMDSHEFEKLYDVYSDQPILTMQLFTSDIMQMLLDFKENYDIFPEITMKENCLYLRFAIRKNLFEPNWYKRVLDYHDTQNHYMFIQSIMKLNHSLLNNVMEVEW